MPYRNLPALNLLATFEVAARRLSFTEAAIELCVTQSAVSRQVKLLEEQIGVPLFRRLHRALELTHEGQKLLTTVTLNIKDLQACIAEIRADHGMPQITVATSVSFAYFWLMPRLASFSEAYPQVDIRILATDQAIDPSKESADIAVHYGNGKWPELSADLLFGERVYPVCSPAYLKAAGELRSPSDLLDQTLLHLYGGGAIWGGVDWSAMLKANGADGQPARPGIRMNNYPMIIQAVLAGRGVALGWSYITDEMVARGLLVNPLDISLATENGYYLVASRETSHADYVNAFCRWILAEVSMKHKTPGFKPKTHA